MNHDPNRDAKPLQGRRKRLLMKIVLWSAGAVLGLIVVAGIAAETLLHNQRFHRYLLKTIQAQASASLGVRVQLQEFALHLSTLSLDLYGLTVDGAAPYADRPLLQVEHAEAGVRIVSILHRKWYLDSFRIDRPIVQIVVDAHGVSNLPKFKSSGGSSSNTSVFDLAVRHAVLDRGEIYYNDKQSALAADLHNVDFQAAYNVLLNKYSGKLSYADGHLTASGLKTLPHSLEAEFDATPEAFHLTDAKLSTGPSQLMLVATLANYANPNIDAHYDLVIDGSQLASILSAPAIPAGQVRATGALHYAQNGNESLIHALTVNGDLNAGALHLKTPSLRAQLTNIVAHYSLVHGDASLHDLKVNLFGGQLAATGMMISLGGDDSHSTVNAELRGVSLASLKQAFPSASSSAVTVNGRLNAKLSAAWGKSLKDLVAQADAAIHGQLSESSVRKAAVTQNNTAQPGIQLDSAIHGTYTASNSQLALKNSYLRTPQTNLTMNGVVSQRSSLALRLQADDLREEEVIADLFRSAPADHTQQPLGLAGTASFDGTLQGSTSAPHLAGQFQASNFHIHGSEWKVLRANIDASPSQLSLQHGDLEPATRGRIAFDASTGLDKWSFTNTSPVQLELTASQLDIADLVRLAGQQMPVTGTLAVNVKMHGTELNPVGDGNIMATGLVAYDQPINAAKITFAGTGDEAHADLAVQLPSGNIQSKVSVRPRDRTYTARLTASGIQLDQLQALKARNVDASGELSLNANGQGSFDNPQLAATLQIPKLVVQGQSMTGLKLQMDMANHVANANLATSAVNTNIQARAKVELTGDYMADASLDTQSIPFQPLLAVYAPEQAENLSGQAELHARLHGPLKNRNLLEAHLDVPVLKMGYGNNIQLAAASPIHVDYKAGVVTLQRATIRGTDTELQLEGSIPVGASVNTAPMSATLLGTVNLQLAQLFDPDIRTSGQLKLNVHSAGESDIGGQIEIVDAAFSSSDLPVGLQHANGILSVSRDRIAISKFQGTVGGGTLTAQGGATLRPKLQFDIGVSGQGMRMLYPAGMRESIDANVRLVGNPDAAALNGAVNLSDISFTSAFDLSNFINQFSGGVATPPTPGLAQNLQLNLAVRSSNNVSLVSRSLSINGSANLQVRGTAADPVILGRVNLNGGDIILNGDRFLLNGGTIAFVNPSETEPVVNLSLKTTIQQYDVFLRFNGPVDQLRTNYSSNPALPSADIINLLAFGQTTEASAATATPANQAAESLVASQVSSQVTSRVSKIAGISQLSISPVLTSGTSAGPPGANITIQQRVTSNLFVTFSSNVATTQSQTIQGQYQLSPRVALSVTRDQNGGFAFDALIKKSW
ncbi:MAG TPA: translocation/assembly module TamB domain-containing protein [Acidobacteriaceae bacterium]|nr:translocation/assembly module TamB domain-containing protein [Acidobacteriaceae bacterium]